MPTNVMQYCQDYGNFKILKKDSNLLMASFVSATLILGGFFIFISQYMFSEADLPSVSSLSIILVGMGCILQLIARLNLEDWMKTHFISLVIFFSIPIIVLSFKEIDSLAIWAVPFIFILISLISISKTMLIYASISAFFTQIYIWLNVPQVSVTITGSSYLVRIMLLVIAVFLAFYINKQYSNKLKENICQMKKIHELAYRDSLTGLPNRLLFLDRLSQGILLAQRMEKPLGVIFLDLDGFKMINDTVGHQQGDQLIKKVATRLSKTLRQGDTIARIGGDKFLILVENLTDNEAMTKISKKIIDSFQQSYQVESQEFYISTSLGVAVYPIDGTNAEMLVTNADIAMYKAKEQGKNQYVLCTPAMKAQISETMKLTNSLYRALERNELMVYYQPQVSNVSGEIIGFEALLRWNHPKLGFIPPNKFIPIAEQSGLIIPIGEWVLRTACEQNKAWQDAGFPPVRMGVNVSIFQLQSPDIVSVVEGILKETGLSPQHLELEITETVAMGETEYIVKVLQAFKSLGVTISIDDFGTAYSSLNYLKELPVDRIKIAMTFIQGIDISNRDEAIAKAIIVLAKNLGLNVIAEGVETENQLSFLKLQSCDEIQGFYYYKPMPSKCIDELLAKLVL